MSELWSFGGLSLKQFGKRVWAEVQEDEVFGRSAELAYYFLLALFPLLLFLTSLFGLLLGEGTELRHALFNYLSKVLPGAAYTLVDSTMTEISAASSGGKVMFGLLAALWAASNGMGAITTALNSAYDVKETRRWWKQRLVAISLTVSLSVLIITALVLVLYGGRLGQEFGERMGLGATFLTVWTTLQWPTVLGFMLLAFALIYYLAPDVPKQKFEWITPGSVLGVTLWLLVSLGFRVYLHFFNSYSKTYGSLGAVIILMLWLYLTGTAILLGGEANGVIKDAATKRSEEGAKEEAENIPSY